MTTQPPRILLVEDDGNISHILKLTLQNLNVPYELDAAFTTEEALDLWQQHPYDLLMTDYNLRGRTGLELIQHLKEQGVTAPMVLFTAYDSPKLRQEAGEAGVAKFVSKPFFMDDFLDLTRSLLPVAVNQLGG